MKFLRHVFIFLFLLLIYYIQAEDRVLVSNYSDGKEDIYLFSRNGDTFSVLVNNKTLIPGSSLCNSEKLTSAGFSSFYCGGTPVVSAVTSDKKILFFVPEEDETLRTFSRSFNYTVRSISYAGCTDKWHVFYIAFDRQIYKAYFDYDLTEFTVNYIVMNDIVYLKFNTFLYDTTAAAVAETGVSSPIYADYNFDRKNLAFNGTGSGNFVQELACGIGYQCPSQSSINFTDLDITIRVSSIYSIFDCRLLYIGENKYACLYASKTRTFAPSQNILLFFKVPDSFDPRSTVSPVELIPGCDKQYFFGEYDNGKICIIGSDSNRLYEYEISTESLRPALKQSFSKLRLAGHCRSNGQDCFYFTNRDSANLNFFCNGISNLSFMKSLTMSSPVNFEDIFLVPKDTGTVPLFFFKNCIVSFENSYVVKKDVDYHCLSESVNDVYHYMSSLSSEVIDVRYE